MPHSAYDAIVLGCGGIGSAALSALARRGARVLGLEQFTPGHDRGSSHGRTRMIRQAYFEHPDYVPLVRRAYQLWSDLERRSGTRLFIETGLLEVGPESGVVVPGVLASAREHALEVDRLSAAEVAQRWPGFRVPAGSCGVFEKRAGYLRVEPCVVAQLDDATRAGADLRCGERVVEIANSAPQIVVRTERESFAARRLVITAGPWAARWLADSGVALAVRRKPQFWFATDTADYRADRGGPAFWYARPQGVYYGFPEIDPGEMKIAEHSGGQPVADATNVDRELDAADQARVAAFVAECLPGVSHRVVRHSVCMYTMSADEHFIVDHHPRDERITFAAGLSGHGFKFAPVLGEALADLTLAGRSELPIEFLRCGRAGLKATSPSVGQAPRA